MSVSSVASRLAVAMAMLAVTSSADATTYWGTRQLGGPLTAALKVETDGTLGVLAASNVLHFRVTFSGLLEDDVANYGAHPTIQSNFVTLNGISLSATQTRLFFDFDSVGGLFGVNNGSFYLFASRDCGCGLFAGEAFELDPEFGNAISRSGFQELAAVPEPGSWAMLVAGFGLVGALTRRRRGLAA